MAHDSYKRWQVTGYRRDVIDYDQDGTAFPTGARETVSVIIDGPRRFEVVLDQDGQISELTISGGGPVTPEVLRRVPVSYLADAARGIENSFEEGKDDGLSDAAAIATIGVAGVDEGESDPGRDGPPTPEEFASAWHRTPASIITAEGKRVTRRQALANQFSVTVWTVDKWSRAARDRGLISKDRPGAPRGSGASAKKKTRGSKPHSQN